MNPFYFGTSERRIFGIYEPAALGSKRKRAAVLCYSWGPEYLYAHRTMRQLAIKLSMAGVHTLRFDYFGTGDSGGDAADTDLKGWESDIALAIEEIKDMVDVTKVSLIGLRLGATVAASVATKLWKEIDALVLWDPIVSGKEYQLSLDPGERERWHGGPKAAGESAQVREASGFVCSTSMIRELPALNLGDMISPPRTRTLMLVTERFPFHQSLAPVPGGGQSGSLDIEYMEAVHPWIEDPTLTGVVPVGVIQRIVNWLG